MIAVLPNRTYRMDNVLCIQSKARCDNRITKINASDFPASGKQLISGFFMYPAVNTGTDDRVRISSVHHCIHLHIYNIISYYFKRHRHSPCFISD